MTLFGVKAAGLPLHAKQTILTGKTLRTLKYEFKNIFEFLCPKNFKKKLKLFPVEYNEKTLGKTEAHGRYWAVSIFPKVFLIVLDWEKFKFYF